MHLTSITPILNVSDVPASLAWFEKLNWQRAFTWNASGMIERAADTNASGPANFASICAGDPMILLSQNGQGSRGTPPDLNAIARASGGATASTTKTPAESGCLGGSRPPPK